MKEPKFKLGEKAQIIKNKDHVLFKTKESEYHLSLEEYNRLGEEKAREYAKREIEKKLNSKYSNKTINFEQARDLGFCKYGIKDFCNQLNLDIDKEYTLEFLNKSITLGVLKKYLSECIKLFGKDTLKCLGGVLGVLSEDTFDLVLREVFISGKTLHKLACDFAMSVIENFEKEFPDDKRPRQAIEAKIKWLNGEITQEELAVAEAAAWSAAESAAESARSAWSAAESAAWSAAEVAAWSARSARSAERKKQVKMIRMELEKCKN